MKWKARTFVLVVKTLPEYVWVSSGFRTPMLICMDGKELIFHEKSKLHIILMVSLHVTI